MPDHYNELSLEKWQKALQAWAEEKGINPAEFAKRMDYTYQHAWGLLSGDRLVTHETLGRFLVCYGDAELLHLMSYIEQSEPVPQTTGAIDE